MSLYDDFIKKIPIRLDPLILAVLEESFEQAERHNEEHKLFVAISGFTVSINILDSLLKSTLSSFDHLTLNYHNQTFEIYPDSFVIKQIDQLRTLLNESTSPLFDLLSGNVH